MSYDVVVCSACFRRVRSLSWSALTSRRAHTSKKVTLKSDPVDTDALGSY